MSFFVLLIVGGALYTAAHVFPGVAELLRSLAFRLPDVPAWALAQGVQANPWREIMPLLGWGAGGFASQVWYTYWVLGAGYGSAAGRGYGEPADTAALGRMTRASAEKIKGWCHVVYADATIALVIGVVVTGRVRPRRGGRPAHAAARAERRRRGAGRQHRRDLLDPVGRDRRHGLPGRRGGRPRRDAARPAGRLAAPPRRRLPPGRSRRCTGGSRGGRSSASSWSCSSART